MTALDTNATTDLEALEAVDVLDDRIEAYADRLFETGLAALEAITISLGRELGLYAHLTDLQGRTASQVADASGIDERYAREWLEQQAACGLIDVVGPVDPDPPSHRRFALSLAGQECLLSPESLASVGPLFDLLPSVTRVFPERLAEAFRTGGGIPYGDYALHDAQGDFNRPVYLNLLVDEWLPQVPGLVERLGRPGARAAEIGCGEGWAAIALALEFPDLHVDAYDDDEPSIDAARTHAREAGVGDRVHVHVADVTSPDTGEAATADLVLALEMIHDLARPVAALSTMRRMGRADAVCLVMDENVAETFEPGTDNPVERLMYAVSVLHCLPVGRVEPESAATGTVMRPATLRGYARSAGFADAEVLAVEHPLFRFYRLVG